MGVAERARKGEDFAKLAAEVSADDGSKAQGGDLGWMTPRDAPFEKALFAMQPGAISDPVRSDFGFHVIKLDEIRPATVRPFEEVRDELAADLRTRKAEQMFYDRSNQLADRSFDAYNQLATVASEMKLPLKTVSNFPRTGDPAVFSNSAPVVQAAFDEQNVDSGRNSSLVELAEDQVLVLRVTAHHVPMVKPLQEVHDQIRDELKRARAQELAEQASQAFLTAIQAPNADPAALAAAAERVLDRAGLGRANECRRADRGSRGRVRFAEARGGPGDPRARRSRERRARGAGIVERAAGHPRFHSSRRPRPAPAAACRPVRVLRAHGLRWARCASRRRSGYRKT